MTTKQSKPKAVMSYCQILWIGRLSGGVLPGSVNELNALKDILQ